MTKKLIGIIFGLLSFIILNDSIYAVTYYVDQANPNASDTNPGTEASPWLTIGRAVCGSTDCISSPNANAAIKAGDTVLVKAGTYYQYRTNSNRLLSVLQPANSGSTGNPITIKAYPGDLVTITYASGQSGLGPLIGSYKRSYITWDGFIIQEVAANNKADTGPVVITGDSQSNLSQNNTIQNCDIRGVVVMVQDNHVGIRIDNSSYASIFNNKVHGVGDGFAGSHNHAEIMSYGANYLTIQNNEVYDANAGIFPKGGVGSNNFNVIIKNNLIHDVKDGIRVSFSKNVNIYQNILYNVRGVDVNFGESCYSLTCGGTLDIVGDTNIFVYNNTIYGNNDRGMYFPQPQTDRTIQPGNVIRNNIISSIIYPGTTESVVSSKFIVNYNNYYSYSALRYGGSNYSLSQWQGLGYDANSITSNPLFVNPTALDFHLQAGSPARNAGVDTFDIDGDGNTIESVNMGAYVTGFETIGITTGALVSPPPTPPDTTPPVKPKGFRLRIR